KLRWDERTREPHAGLLAWYRELIALRCRTPALMDGRLETVRVRHDEADRWLVIERGPITVACNLAPGPRDVRLTPGRPATVLLASDPDARVRGDCIHLGPERVAVIG